MTNSVMVAFLLMLLACSSDEEPTVISQHLEAHQLEIVSIEMQVNEGIILRPNQSYQLQVYGVLSDGSRLQTEEDSQGNTQDRSINDIVSWSVDDEELAKISEEGLLSANDSAGTVVAMASFAGQEATASVIITDAALDEIIVDTTITSVEACRNLEFTAIGILEDGNEISFASDELVWSAVNTDTTNIVADFKSETVGELSTYLSGSVTISAEETASEVSSSSINITVADGPTSIVLSNSANDELKVSQSLEILATGIYQDGEFDITANSVFISRNEDLATFNGNTLTAKTTVGIVEITGSCNTLVNGLEINIIN